MIYILDKINGELVRSEIIIADPKDIPLKKNGWNFNWRQLSGGGYVLVLQTFDSILAQTIKFE